MSEPTIPAPRSEATTDAHRAAFNAYQTAVGRPPHLFELDALMAALMAAEMSGDTIARVTVSGEQVGAFLERARWVDALLPSYAKVRDLAAEARTAPDGYQRAVLDELADAITGHLATLRSMLGETS